MAAIPEMYSSSVKEAALLQRGVNIGFFSVLALLLILTAIMIERFNVLANEMTRVVQVNQEKSMLAFNMRDSIRQRSVALHKMMSTDDVFKRNELALLMQEYARSYRENREKLVAFSQDQKEAELHQRLSETVRESQPRVRAAMDLLIQNAPKDESEYMVNQGIQFMEKVLNILDELVLLQRQYSIQAVENATSTNRKVTQIVLFISLISLGIGALIARFVTRFISKHNKVLVENNKALYESSQRAEQADKAKSQFLANMSHEIRTPMNGVIGVLELLNATSLSEEQQEFINIAEQSAHSLLAVINDILDFSKIEAGKLHFEHISFDMVQAIDDTVALMVEAARRRGNQLECSIDPRIMDSVMGDPMRLRQILSNLLSNAIKFTENGRIKVTVFKQQGDFYRIEVHDTGIGMSAPATSHIFDAFSQADGSTTRHFGGTGLGLSICSQLARMFGGTIGVETESGIGSCFWFTVKLPRSGEQRDILEPLREYLDKRLLIVSENVESSTYLSSVLRAWGFHCYTAHCGSHALEELVNSSNRAEGYDLVLVDICNSERPWHEIQSYLSRDTELSQIELVAFGYPNDGGKRWAAEHNASAWISYPIRQHALVSTLAGVWSQTLAQSVATDTMPELKSSGKLLLVEDNEVNIKVASTMLSKLGIDFVVANQGEMAFNLFKHNEYSLVLMDCHMPVLDGFETTKKIRQWEQAQRRSRTPIIALTANAMEGDRERCIEAGMDDYISKPISIKKLRKAFGEWNPQVENEPVPDNKLIPRSLVNTEILQELQDLMSQREWRSVLHKYLNSSDKMLEKVKTSVANQDWDALHFAAHTLKGASASIGATHLAQICNEVCVQAKKQTALPEGLLEKLESEYLAVKDFLSGKAA